LTDIGDDRMLIDGASVDASDGAAFGSIDRATGRESGFQAMYDDTRPKTVWINMSDGPPGGQFVVR
jgi:hypothetical protein